MKKLKLGGNNILLAITVALFVIMYLGGCIIYADKGSPVGRQRQVDF